MLYRSTLAWLALAVVVLPTLSVRAQTNPTAEETPEAVAGRAMTALKESRLADFASAMHPDALKQFKSALLSAFDAAEERGKTKVIKQILALFKAAASLKELHELDDAAFFAAFLEGAMRQRPGFSDAARTMTVEVIGHVAERPDLVHVLYRGTVTVGDQKVTQLAVVSLKPFGKGWRMLLTEDAKGLAAAVRRQLEVDD